MTTKHKKGGVDPFKAEDFTPYAEATKALAGTVEWEHVKARGGDRTADTWAPLLEVDALLGGEWASFATAQMEKARANLILGHEEEPTQAMYLALLTLAVPEGSGEPAKRVLLADISKSIQDGQRLVLSQPGIGSYLRNYPKLLSSL